MAGGGTVLVAVGEGVRVIVGVGEYRLVMVGVGVSLKGASACGEG